MKTDSELNLTLKLREVEGKIASSFQCKSLPDARRITVEIRGGWVILRGSVHSWVERAEAQWAAFAAPGVSEVENNIMIGP